MIVLSSLQENILVDVLGEPLEDIYKKIDESYAYINPVTCPKARNDGERQRMAIAMVLAAHFSKMWMEDQKEHEVPVIKNEVDEKYVLDHYVGVSEMETILLMMRRLFIICNFQFVADDYLANQKDNDD